MGSRAGKLSGRASMVEELGRADLLRNAASAPVLGSFVIELQNARTVRVVAQAGFDFVVLDMEHSGCSIRDLEPLIAEARAAGVVPVVRVPESGSSMISRVLDVGAAGVMVPHIESPEQAQAAVDAARFAPEGHRGFSPLTPFQVLENPQRSLNEAVLVIVQIEGREALANVDAISAIAGVDAIFVGPYDLAESLETPSDIGSPLVLAAAESIAKQVAGRSVLGIYMDDPHLSGQWAERGFGLQCISFDGQMLLESAQRVLAKAKSSVRTDGAPSPMIPQEKRKS